MIGSPMEKDAYARWTDAQAKLLINLYPGFKKRLDNGRISSPKKMWEQMSKIMEEHGYCYSPAQVESKWKALGRSLVKRTEHKPRFKRQPRSYQKELNQALDRALKPNTLHLVEEEPLTSEDDLLQQVTKRISVSRAPRDILKLAERQNVPSVVAVYNFDSVPSSTQQRPRQLPVPVETEDVSEEDLSVDLDQAGGSSEESVLFAQTVSENRQSSQNVAEELVALREEFERAQARKEKASETKERTEARRHKERMEVLKTLLDQLKEHQVGT